MEDDHAELHLNTISEAIDDIASGKMVIVVDDANRENEGDVVMAAECCTAENMNFLVKNARGLVCAPVLSEIAEKLKLDLMVERNTDLHGTAFTVSVDAMEGTTTGISADDRAVTIRKLSDPSSTSGDFRRPGHIFPLIAKPGGVLKRAGHTEAAVDLALMAGKRGAGAICEILNEDGSMARFPQLLDFAHAHELKIVSVADLIKYRLSREKLVIREAEVRLPTEYGDFCGYAYRYLPDDESLVHLALVKGDLESADSVLVRVHSECLTGDTFGSLRCDCGEQLHSAMNMIDKEGIGVILYLRQEGRGIGLLAKLKAYELQEQGLDTEDANIALGYAPDLRDYGVGAQILLDLGIKKIRLMTNNPRKVVGLEGYGLEITERVQLEFPANEHNKKYLQTKCCKMGHVLHVN
ncbi:MAG: bifunctional 3,4-dihydroxy-2-butanone-4-phosphate synthase/GTP cyclohydrolase II [Synergistaceae bacterium]|jgi:3,4-dihydroxy 2-butanone 4-phosphate synthase/GTP cyclohydrolase II|nr:bifunctional 3,4-dihydroxy-2-butanone-4-phosphate synthase/GTP cyclohydrolase II [Synergistaceae bacterium]